MRGTKTIVDPRMGTIRETPIFDHPPRRRLRPGPVIAPASQIASVSQITPGAFNSLTAAPLNPYMNSSLTAAPRNPYMNSTMISSNGGLTINSNPSGITTL